MTTGDLFGIWLMFFSFAMLGGLFYEDKDGNSRIDVGLFLALIRPLVVVYLFCKWVVTSIMYIRKNTL